MEVGSLGVQKLNSARAGSQTQAEDQLLREGGNGTIYAEGSLPATRIDLERWMKTLPQPWSAALEATMFTGWIYDHLKPHAAALKMARPLDASGYFRSEKEKRPH